MGHGPVGGGELPAREYDGRNELALCLKTLYPMIKHHCALFWHIHLESVLPPYYPQAFLLLGSWRFRVFWMTHRGKKKARKNKRAF